MELGFYTFADMAPDNRPGKAVNTHQRIRDLLEEIQLADQRSPKGVLMVGSPQQVIDSAGHGIAWNEGGAGDSKSPEGPGRTGSTGLSLYIAFITKKPEPCWQKK